MSSKSPNLQIIAFAGCCLDGHGAGRGYELVTRAPFSGLEVRREVNSHSDLESTSEGLEQGPT